MSLNMSTPSSSLKFENHSVLSPSDHSSVEGVLNLVELNTNKPDPFNLGPLSSEIERVPSARGRKAGIESLNMPSQQLHLRISVAMLAAWILQKFLLVLSVHLLFHFIVGLRECKNCTKMSSCCYVVLN